MLIYSNIFHYVKVKDNLKYMEIVIKNFFLVPDVSDFRLTCIKCRKLVYYVVLKKIRENKLSMGGERGACREMIFFNLNWNVILK